MYTCLLNIFSGSRAMGGLQSKPGIGMVWRHRWSFSRFFYKEMTLCAPVAPRVGCRGMFAVGSVMPQEPVCACAHTLIMHRLGGHVCVSRWRAKSSPSLLLSFHTNASPVLCASTLPPSWGCVIWFLAQIVLPSPCDLGSALLSCATQYDLC